MSKSDLVRVRHMLDATREALFFVSGKTREDLHGDRMLVLSCTRLLEIIGEAASQVSPEFQARYGTPVLRRNHRYSGDTPRDTRCRMGLSCSPVYPLLNLPRPSTAASQPFLPGRSTTSRGR